MKRSNINVVCVKPVAQHLNEKTWNVDDIISSFEVNDLEFLSPILCVESASGNNDMGQKEWRNCLYAETHSGKQYHQTVKNHLCRTNECSWNSPILQRTNYPKCS